MTETGKKDIIKDASVITFLDTTINNWYTNAFEKCRPVLVHYFVFSGGVQWRELLHNLYAFAFVGSAELILSNGADEVT